MTLKPEGRVFLDTMALAEMVNPIAKLNRLIKDGYTLVIPNTADVGIFKNKSMKTNTVIVCLGKPSALKKVIARATGDPGRLAMALGVAIALTAAAIAVMAAIIKHRKEENDLSDEMNDRHGERKEE